MKTYLYNFEPLKPHFYIVKLGFTGVYIIFLISAQNHRLWVLVRTASARRFLRVPAIYVLSRNMKNIRIFIWKFSVFLWWNSQYIWIGVFSYGLSKRCRKVGRSSEDPIFRGTTVKMLLTTPPFIVTIFAIMVKVTDLCKWDTRFVRARELTFRTNIWNTNCLYRISLAHRYVCLCWGFTILSSQLGHVERGQFT